MSVTPTTIALFFFNDTATTEIYTLSLHDALPIYSVCTNAVMAIADAAAEGGEIRGGMHAINQEKIIAASTGLDEWKDRKGTRLNSSHSQISYAGFCLKKKKE